MSACWRAGGTALAFLMEPEPELVILRTERVLVVEDDTSLRHSVAVFLGHHGIDVMATDERAVAEKMLRAESVDWLVTDLDLPDGTGLELAQVAQRLQPALRVLLMTGYSCSAVRKQACQLGLAYLEKPFDMEDLLRAMRPDELEASAAS